MQPLLDLTPGELTAWLQERGQAKFRARQILQWVFQRRATSFDEMTDLPKDLREQLQASLGLFQGSIAQHRVADDGSEKLLIEWPGGGRIECVLLREGARRSICISTQVGCAMGCVFCASGLDGVDRNLTRGEILEQCLRLRNLLPIDERLSHVIVMGMGEPLANYQNLLPALDVVRDSSGLGVSARRITISTVGLPPAMDRLSESGAPYHLAVSLHAPNDSLRNQLVPVNERIGVQEILRAADRFFERSGRRVTYEYVLLADVNDAPEHARQLAGLLRGRNALLNVIPYNPVAGLPYRTPSAAAARDFKRILVEQGINVQFRKRKGDQIDAACGQLRRMAAQELGSLTRLENGSPPDSDATSPPVAGS